MHALSDDKSIVITKADKGNAVVVQNVDDYTKKIAALLAVDGKFVCLNENPTKKREATLQRRLRALHNKGVFEK